MPRPSPGFAPGKPEAAAGMPPLPSNAPEGISVLQLMSALPEDPRGAVLAGGGKDQEDINNVIYIFREEGNPLAIQADLAREDGTVLQEFPGPDTSPLPLNGATGP